MGRVGRKEIPNLSACYIHFTSSGNDGIFYFIRQDEATRDVKKKL